MGYFNNINLNNYRNFSKFSLDFSKESNVLLGENGSGKTNILEAISLLEKGNGFRKEKIINLNNFNATNKGFIVKSNFLDNRNEYNAKVFSSEKNLKKKSINESFEKSSINYFESLFSIIYFLPEMERMFLASPSFRRNFLDRLIFTTNKNYNSVINSYKKSVFERQLILRGSNIDEEWITNIERNIVKYGSIIYDKRNSHIENINSILKDINKEKHFSAEFFLKIHDEFILKYPKLYENKDLYLSEIKNKRKIDSLSGRCAIGPHRSDILGYNIINNFNLNQLSTGQQKTIVLLIIISQSIYLNNNFDIKPIILLDEACSHLDNINRELILYLVNILKAQVFMTGTDKKFFSFLSTKTNYCNIT